MTACHARPQFLPAQAIDTAIESQVLPHRQVPVKGEFLGNIPQIPPALPARLPQIHASHRQPTLGRWQQAAEHTERRRLARAIRPEQPKDLAPVYLKGRMVHRREITKPADQSGHLDIHQLRGGLRGIGNGRRAAD
jgi:hypothetical protein